MAPSLPIHSTVNATGLSTIPAELHLSVDAMS